MNKWEAIHRLCNAEVARESEIRYEYGDWRDPICAPDCQKHNDEDEAPQCWLEYYATDRCEKWEKAKIEKQNEKTKKELAELEAKKKYYEKHPEDRPPAPPQHCNCR